MLIRIVHDSLYGASLGLNALLITLILTKTPAYLRCYSLVLLYLAVVELTTAVSSLLVFKKVMSTPSYYLSAAGGVCRHWGSPSLCFSLNAIQLAGTAHYAVMIAFCSCYRYYVITRSHGEPRRRNVLLALFSIHLPTILIYTNFAFSRLLKGAELERAMNESHPEYDMEKHRDDEMLLVTRRGFSDRLALYWLEGLIVPVIVVVVVASVRINRILASVQHMSANNKRRHAQILKGIIWQATLPALYAVGLATYGATKRKMISGDEIGHLTIMIGSLITALCPIFTLIFTIPYREALKRMFCTGICGKKFSDVSSPIVSNEAQALL